MILLSIIGLAFLLLGAFGVAYGIANEGDTERLRFHAKPLYKTEVLAYGGIAIFFLGFVLLSYSEIAMLQKGPSKGVDMSVLLHSLGKDYHWTMVLVMQVIGALMVLYADVSGVGPAITKPWQRAMHIAAIIVWEVTAVFALLYFIFLVGGIVLDSMSEYWAKTKRKFSLKS